MDTQLLVIGAGPYGLSTAALAREHGISTKVVGTPMGFWRTNMPEAMFLRSGADWHLDGAGVHTLEAYLQERGISRQEVDPIPIGLFLDYAEWFRQIKRVEVGQRVVTDLAKPDGHFEATLNSGEKIVADAVVAAPGIRHYQAFPEWASRLPAERMAHTCDLVDFEDMAGARVLIVGGRQSAYEWAALALEHDAARVDIVHRHEIPRFERVSWKFVDAHVEQTISVPGYWRKLSQGEQKAIARRFWEVGRLTLEYWLLPRLASEAIHRWPGTELTQVAERNGNGELAVVLSDTTRLEVDRVIFATGYRAALDKVPYLGGLLDRVKRANGFPVLDEAFQTSVPGLYIPGFSATNDFGPFFGFVKGCPAAATLIVRDLCRN
jgi:cation diffusion facilitator CzcD-associated flavoprotein CzcO